MGHISLRLIHFVGCISCCLVYESVDVCCSSCVLIFFFTRGNFGRRHFFGGFSLSGNSVIIIFRIISASSDHVLLLHAMFLSQ